MSLGNNRLQFLCNGIKRVRRYQHSSPVPQLPQWGICLTLWLALWCEALRRPHSWCSPDLCLKETALAGDFSYGGVRASFPSICQRKTDSVLTWKKEGDVNVSNRHWQRCMWGNSWKILPKLVTFRLKRKVSIEHMQMTSISTSDCNRTSQKGPKSSIPETQTCHTR